MSLVQYFTRHEAAAYLRVSVRTIDRYADDGKLPAFRIKGIQSVRFKRADLDALVVPEPDKEEAPAR